MRAELVLKGPGKMTPEQHRAYIAQLEASGRKIEEALAARSSGFRVAAQPINLEDVRRLIPNGADLVEFIKYKPYNLETTKLDDTWGPPRYAVYVIDQTGAIRWADLGDAATIEKAVDSFRRVLKAPPGRGVDLARSKSRLDSFAQTKAVSRRLDEMIMRPVRKLLGNRTWVLLSPDGALNLVPFAALVDESQSFLIERYLFTYLTTGRDLIRFQADEINSLSAPLILADPDFDKGDDTVSVGQAGTRRSADLSNVVFYSLPGTGEEAKAIAKLLPKATLLLGSKATEGNLKATFAPSILHIATHGFFLSEQSSSLSSARGLSITSGGPRQTFAGIENPLLRSGLGLAGANNRQSGTEDGILTALEASGLFLQGTKLVVLSACETGVGQASNGEGVYGLRRALVMAGSESQVMSLWAVSDEATKDLMISFYNHLLARKGRSQSLREAQIKMLRNVSYRHPYYWAPFIQSGRWTALNQ